MRSLHLPSANAASGHRWAFESVEWSGAVAKAHLQLPSFHYILPDLPETITPAMKNEFFTLIPRERRIQTIAACSHTPQSLSTYATNFNSSDRLLIVGGNDKAHGKMTTLEAIDIIADATESEIWATANPNCPLSVDAVHHKIQHGATGIITQPFLSSGATGIFDMYPLGPLYVAGMAFPTSAKSLVFWSKLLELPNLSSDVLFQDHLSFFRNGGNHQLWTYNELLMLESIESLSGVHYMPLANTKGFRALLQKMGPLD